MIIEIDKTGKAYGLDEDLKEIFNEEDFSTTNKKRFSYIYPKNILLRAIFKFIRKIFSDESKLANWTRSWKCEWIVLINKKVYGPFKTRKKAIEFEKTMFYSSL